MQLTLLIPGLTWARDDDLTGLLAQKPLSALNGIYRFAKVEPSSVHLSQWYASFLPRNSLLDTLRKSLGLPEGNYGLVSPVTQRLNRDFVTLADGGVLNLNLDEAQSLSSDLNEFLMDDGWCFYPISPDLWLWQMADEVAVSFSPVCDVVGENIEDFQPEGTDALKMTRVLTEIQMFLHAHPKNTERQKIGLPLVNGLWFWRDLPVGQSDTADTLVFADNPWFKAMSHCLSAPDSFSTYSQWCEMHQPRQNHHVILLEDALGAVQYQDVWGYQEALISLDERFFQPILIALQSGKIDSLRIATHGVYGGDLLMSPKSHWAFWRSSKRIFTGKLS